MAGSALSFDGKEVGRVTSAVRSPRFRRDRALRFCITAHRTPGTDLKVGEGGAATVIELPFAQKLTNEAIL